MQQHRGFPRVLIAALRGGSGKTILSVGVISALTRRGRLIAPFKKGPDYIDAGWLALAASRPCYNLDTFLIDNPGIVQLFTSKAVSAELSVIEGNRGLYDGIDLAGSTSTAELAKLLDIPVVLCLDCTKTTRTMAAVVAGCKQFDVDVRLAGIVLNRVAGARHESILRQTIEHHCGIPVLGSLPKLDSENFPERHMGLVPTAEHRWATNSVDAAARLVEKNVDLEGLVRLAESAPSIEGPDAVPAAVENGRLPSSSPVKIGIIKDSAFQFYYPDNIEALETAGAEIRMISPLSPAGLPDDIDGLYIGGGFPETHAAQLARNDRFASRLKRFADDGMPIYAECGGLMYLGEKLVLQGNAYPMAGVLPIVFGFSKRPQGHGYTIVTIERENPYYPIGTEIRGHEFHYSKVLEWKGSEKDFAFRMKRGSGLIGRQDGFCYKKVLATYTHIHARGTPGWAEALIRNAAIYRDSKK